jgi:hypothetical protein
VWPRRITGVRNFRQALASPHFGRSFTIRPRSLDFTQETTPMLRVRAVVAVFGGRSVGLHVRERSVKIM